MRSILTAISFLSFLLAGSLSHAADNPIAGIDPLFFVGDGWHWGSFSQPESTIDATNEGILLNIQPAAGGDYPGKVNGSIGLSFATPHFGAMVFDPEQYELEVRFRVLENNEATSFRVMLSEPGTPATGAEFQYHFDGLFDYEENEWNTVTRPLASYDATYTNLPAPLEMRGLLDGFMLGTMWDTSAALNIEVASALLKPVNPTLDNVAFELNANNAKRIWPWDSFREPGAVVNNGETILINLDDDGYEGQTNGGMSTHWLLHDFDAETSELVVTAKLGPDNLASNFVVSLKDDDGLEGIESWDPRELNQSAEEWQFTISTSEFTEDEYVELRLPFLDENGNPTSSWRQKPGGPLTDAARIF